jgi:hypothetical protein
VAETEVPLASAEVVDRKQLVEDILTQQQRLRLQLLQQPLWYRVGV